MKLRLTFEIDSDEFGKFNKGSSGKVTTTLDNAPVRDLMDMAVDAARGGNDLLREAALVKLERGERKELSEDPESKSWQPTGGAWSGWIRG